MNTWRGWLIGLLLALSLGGAARAHGGDVVLQHQQDGHELIALLGPAPFRAGPADLSVLIRDQQTQQPVRGARVLLVLDDPADAQPPVELEARPEGDPRILVYGSHEINFTHAGDWQLRIVAVAPGLSIDQTAQVSILSNAIRWLEILLYSLPALCLLALVLAKRRQTRRARSAVAQGE